MLTRKCASHDDKNDDARTSNTVSSPSSTKGVWSHWKDIWAKECTFLLELLDEYYESQQKPDGDNDDEL